MKNKTRVAGIVLAFMAVTTTAGALSTSNEPINDAEPGSVHLLATEAVAAGDVGKECSATIIATNNESIRQGTDLIVTSGSEVIVPNIEAKAGELKTLATIILSNTITISVRIGPDRQASVTAIVTTLCPNLGPPTSSPPVPVVKPPIFTG